MAKAKKSSTKKEESLGSKLKEIFDKLLGPISNSIYILVPCLFLVFASLIAVFNNTAGDAMVVKGLAETGKWLTNVFQVIYDAILGQVFRSFVLYRLQQGGTMGLLNFVLGCQSELVESAKTFYHYFSWNRIHLMVFVTAIWSLAILGGQACSRAIGFGTSPDGTALVQYLNFDSSSSMDLASGDSGTYETTVSTLFLSAMAAPAASKVSSLDLWGNMKIPMLEELSSPGQDGWYTVNQTNATVYSSLLGIPMAGTPVKNTAVFQMTTSYFKLNCQTFFGVTNQSEMMPYDGEEISGPTCSWGTLNSTSPIIPMKSCNPKDTSYLPRTILYAAGDGIGTVSAGTIAECALESSWVDLSVSCTNQICSVDKMRNSIHDHPPAIITPLDADCVGQEYVPLILGKLHDQFTDTTCGAPTALQAYLVDPEAPFVPSLSENLSAPVSSIGNHSFSIRLAQLINAYWISAVAANAIPLGVAPSYASFPSYELGYSNVTAVVLQTGVMKCQWAWWGVLVGSSVVMLLAAIGNTYLYRVTLIPDLEMNVATMARLSRHFKPAVQVGSYLDDSEWSSCQDKALVRFGEVSAVEESQHLMADDDEAKQVHVTEVGPTKSLGIGNAEDVGVIQKKEKYL